VRKQFHNQKLSQETATIIQGESGENYWGEKHERDSAGSFERPDVARPRRLEREREWVKRSSTRKGALGINNTIEQQGRKFSGKKKFASCDIGKEEIPPLGG